MFAYNTTCVLCEYAQGRTILVLFQNTLIRTRLSIDSQMILFIRTIAHYRPSNWHAKNWKISIPIGLRLAIGCKLKLVAWILRKKRDHISLVIRVVYRSILGQRPTCYTKIVHKCMQSLPIRQNYLVRVQKLQSPLEAITYYFLARP